jgi:two-component system response regulator YesN
MKEWTHVEEIDDGTYGNNELLKLSVFRLCKDTIKRNGYGTVFLNNDYIVIIFAAECESNEKSIDRISAHLYEIKQSIIKFYGFSVTMGIGSICSNIYDLHHSYKDAVTALDYRLILGRNKIICIDDIEPRKSGNLFFDELKEKQLTSSIKVGNAEELTKTVDALFEEMGQNNVSFKDCQIYLLQMLTSILKAARDLNIDTDNIIGDNYSIFLDILKLNDLQEIYKCVIALCLKIKNSISRDRQDSCKQIVKEATEYLNNNYNDSEITIDHICGKLHISAAYFSTIFKKETKYTFVNYLTKVRMEAAKELLRTTDCKTFEIAKRVGFSEPNYFSYCFKKKFGVSPSQYRNSTV